MARLRLLLAFSVVLFACDQTPDVDGTALPTGVHRAAERKADDGATEEPSATSDDGVAKPVAPAPAPPITPLPAPTSSSSAAPVPSASASAPAPAPKPIVSAVDVHWSRKSSTAEYSFDIETTAGQLIGPCIDVGTVGQSLSVRYSGVCTSPGIDVPLTQVAKVRVCWTEGGDWSKASCAAMPYDPTEADVTIPN